MIDFFDALSSLEKTYWVIATVGSAVFFLIFILTFIGGGDADMEADASEFEVDDGGVGFQFFTFKGIVAFFTIFGWSGIVCIDQGFATTTTLIVSILAGLIMMFLTSILFYWMYKMSDSGTLKIKNAIGVVCEVYIPIGAKQSTIGKVQIKVQGSLRELDAITNSEEELKSGTIVKVTEIISDELLLVEKISK